MVLTSQSCLATAESGRLALVGRGFDAEGPETKILPTKTAHASPAFGGEASSSLQRLAACVS